MFDLLIKNAVVVTPDRARSLNVAVKDGVIAALLLPSETVEAQEIYDIPGSILFPGLIDSHAHITYCGDIASGSYTAASGGVTTLIEMPTSGWLPDVLDKNIFLERVREINNTSAVDLALWGGVSASDLEKISEVWEAGAAAFKVFLSDAGTYGSFSDWDLEQLFQKLHPYNGLVGIHAETESICAAETKKSIECGAGPVRNSDSRPVISEQLAVLRACKLALNEHGRAHICHISSADVIDIIEDYRNKGADLTAETCPHYLLLNDKDVIRCGSYAKCAPPLRSAEEVERLWECVLSGKIDIIGSDHATYSEKQKEAGTFWEVPGGFPGLDLILSGLYTEGVVKRHLSPEQLAKITSSNAAKAFGINYRKGSIEIGKDADFAVYDPAIKWRFHARNSFYNNKSDRYPYEDRLFQGKVTHTFVRGKLVFENGTIKTPNMGIFIPAHQ